MGGPTETDGQTDWQKEWLTVLGVFQASGKQFTSQQACIAITAANYVLAVSVFRMIN